MSSSEMYRIIPAKKPRYINKNPELKLKKRTDNTPRTGASALIATIANVFLAEFLFKSMSEPVFKPSLNACPITAIATATPSPVEILKPTPIPTPSKKEWMINNIADTKPTDGC